MDFGFDQEDASGRMQVTRVVDIVNEEQFEGLIKPELAKQTS